MSPTDRASALQLYLLRHADAGDPEKWSGDDDARPLSAKGERQSERLGAFLAEIGFRPDAIISSPKVRARRTAEIVADALGLGVRVDERLGGGCDPESVDAILADTGNPRRPVLVGHDPDFSELLGYLSGTDAMSMKKGAFARLDVRGPVAGGGGSLRWLVPPDLLDPERR
ncbi:MAG: histidine phosphatase family protein [Chloroflexota bacterium]|nr:histidine phosphatase family protein [Chloroflexota bacterium]